ncbi:MAG TPA: carbonic anhydrase family protein [Terracidiphilus sp.]|jgi:carbonic anhydrase|nr:carbonic anhydrase family protein [Terracidiphilus sp.]
MRIPALIALAMALTGVAAAQHGAPWSYQGKTGPINWGKLDPEYRACSQGHQQSPIDIRGAHLNKTLQPIEFHYMAGPVTLENNGHTILVTVKPGSYIVANGVRYDLVQFHFHHPAEEAVHGRLDDMDIHLVHQSADGKLAVIAVRLREDPGQPNATMATLWQSMPTKSGQSEHVDGPVNPGGLLPADRGYWTYMGSLTTPPCTEGVRWFVLEQDLAISREQLRQFAQIYRINSRPIQETHGRRIEANE